MLRLGRRIRVQGPLTRLRPGTVTARRPLATPLLSQRIALFSSANTEEVDEQIAELIRQSGRGNLKRIQELVASGVPVNGHDYDQRTPLHLAAAEGRLEAVKFLLDKGADINATDRFFSTPLYDAIRSKSDKIITELVSRGATVTDKTKLAQEFCAAATSSDVAHIQRLLMAGAEVNAVDADLRTPLHLATAAAKIHAVEALVAAGSNVNAVDRFGNTPLADAKRGRGRENIPIVKVLEEAGARVGDNVGFHGPKFQVAVDQSLSPLCERGAFDLAEVWIPTLDGSQIVESGHWAKGGIIGLAESLREFMTKTQDTKGATAVARCFTGKQPVLIDSPQTDHEALGDRAKEATSTRVERVFCLPVMWEGEVKAVFQFFAWQKPNSEIDLNRFVDVANGMVQAGTFGVSVAPKFVFDHDDWVMQQMSAVYLQITKEGVYTPTTVYDTVDWFYGLGLPVDYFKSTQDSIIANHILAYISAAKHAQAVHNDERVWLHIENNSKLLGAGGPEQSLHMVPALTRTLLAVERNIEKRIALVPKDKSYSLAVYLSAKPFSRSSGSNTPLSVYVLSTSPFNNASSVGTASSNIWEVCSENFSKKKSKPVRERYQDVINVCLARVSPVAQAFPPYRDGTTPVMIAFKRGHGTTASYQIQLTHLLVQHGLVARRKFIETFSNGVIVYSLYVEPLETQELTNKRVEELLKSFSLLHLVPESQLTEQFLTGKIDAAAYTYLSAATRFCYYFINQRNADFTFLKKELASQPRLNSRLVALNTKLRREAVSHVRIFECFAANPEITAQIVDDFTQRARSPESNLSVNPTLQRRIEKGAASPMDEQILTSMLIFNAHVLKTNFFKKKKAALSFRMDPGVLAASYSEWPQTPFGIFFVMGSDFQGFHIRFQDVSRGGIRIIMSRNGSAYNTNLGSLFAENYGLAYTQNKKNKDIPEFGSKGTVLLHSHAQGNQFLAFQKYISGLLDLLTPDADIVDRYGKTEILFCGPDEGTAPFMQWAAEYARNRKYKFWRSFTTGKPPLLGGIPHDTFGMTTRSVHAAVLGVLEKFGIDERTITKFQTGGPDGDLGSNEILLSQDKTIAIVDGGGVVYDPAGLNREELTRLAKARLTCAAFDTTKLGKGGFQVKLTDTDVTLPSGEKVENGLVFRNEFHLHPLSSADLFVPCGGRPEAVNNDNVSKMFHPDGVTPRFKYIIEGANLFFTNDARLTLENAGVILMKDASTNKGGVTSSSQEVLAALALDEETFEQNMVVRDGHTPAFYMEYVEAIQRRIEADARAEFECIWREHQRTGTPRHILTDIVSDKINNLAIFMNTSADESNLYNNVKLREIVLKRAIPECLQRLAGLDSIIKRTPEMYLKATFSTYLASRYVYAHGIEGNEFAFFGFMQKFLDETK